MSYARMTAGEEVLAQEVSGLLAEAEHTDRDDDARYGEHRRGDELPEELRRRESGLATIAEAKAALEVGAAQVGAEAVRARSGERGQDEATAAGNADAAAAEATPTPKAQRNFTDPDSRIMKTADGSFHQCDNAQAVVDAEHQVIVAAEVNQCASDVGTLIPMTDQAATAATAGQVLADAGYCSTDTLDAAAEDRDQHGSEFFTATGRRSHDEPAPVAPRADRSRKTPHPSRRWPARWPPNPAGAPTHDARRSWNRCSDRCPPRKTLNSCCCAGSTGRTVNGCYWPPATTSANPTATPGQPGYKPRPPAEPDRRPHTTAHTSQVSRPTRDTALNGTPAHHTNHPFTGHPAHGHT